MLVKGAAKPMKERLGGRPTSAAKTWAARGKRRLQEIRNLIGRGDRGEPGGGVGRERAPRQSEKPQQLRAAARVGTGSLRAPAEAMRAPLPGTPGGGELQERPGRKGGAGSRCLRPAPDPAPGRLSLKR